MIDTYRLVLHVDIDAEDASQAYEKTFDAMMATGLPWESTDEWYDHNAEQRMSVEDINAATEQFGARRSDPMLAGDLRARIYERRLKEDAQLTALLDGFQKLFEQAPQVLAVRWEQYTPYFNSCDPCEFHVRPPKFRLAGRDGYHEYFGWREPRSDEEREINAALKPIIPVQLFSFAYREAFQSTFGDHVVVTMHRDLDVVIEDHVHD